MSRVLKMGDSGEDVRVLQKAVNKHLELIGGPSLSPDGHFGKKTFLKIVEFQKLNRLKPDGIVGDKTRAALLDFRTVVVRSEINSSAPSSPTTTSTSAPSTARPPATPSTPASPGAPDDPPKKRSFQLLAGAQLTLDPWVVSPLVLTAQMNFFIRRHRFPPVIEISPGAQFSANTRHSAAGNYGAELFVQVSLAEITDKWKIDWLNPFVQVALSQNQGQALTAAFALGDQMNINLGKSGVYSFFLNGQEVWNLNLRTGAFDFKPSTQVLGGISIELK
jgi:hypothetical protein